VHLGIVKTLFLLHILYGCGVGVAWAWRGRIVFVVFSWLALPGDCCMFFFWFYILQKLQLYILSFLSPITGPEK